MDNQAPKKEHLIKSGIFVAQWRGAFQGWLMMAGILNGALVVEALNAAMAHEVEKMKKQRG
jgi:ABC-type enterobactin transport system permease subunit